MSTGEKYLWAAYLVVFAAVLLYVVLISLKVGRLERELDRARASWRGSGRAAVAELLVWPALLAYGEAAVAYAGNARRPGSLGRLATWGVRLGWLAQTALLVVQATDADGFPWSTWAGSLNLFVWLVVSAYLIWGCSPRYRLLGLGVMPLAAALLAISYAAGGTDDAAGAAWGDVVLVLHIALMLVSFAGFTVAGGLAALELWQERELKSHPAPGSCGSGCPSLVALDRLTVTTVAVSLAALTAGIVAGPRAASGSRPRRPDRGHRRPLVARRVRPLSRVARRPPRACRRAHARRRRRRHRPPTRAPVRPRRMKLLVVGTSHRLAPVEVRERVALDGEGEAALAQRLRRERRGGVPLDVQPHRALPRCRGRGRRR